jgi:UPF0148 protein
LSHAASKKKKFAANQSLDMSSEDNKDRIKSAASLLIRGGTLTSEACPRCGGVQVRFADKTTCINCGNETKSGASRDADMKIVPAPGTKSMEAVTSIIQDKIALLTAELRTETDISIQKQLADLLESYIRILEKAKGLMG